MTLWGDGGRYQRWADFLDRWGHGEPLDPAHLPPLHPEDFTPDSWQRLVDRISDALSTRLQTWADVLSRELGHAPDEFSAARALGHARANLRSIRALAGHPALPSDLGARLVEMIDSQITAVQRTLDEQVDAMRRSAVNRTVVEARLRTLRDNSLAVVVGEDATRPTDGPPDAWAGDPANPPRRRVVLVDPPGPQV